MKKNITLSTNKNVLVSRDKEQMQNSKKLLGIKTDSRLNALTRVKFKLILIKKG